MYKFCQLQRDSKASENNTATGTLGAWGWRCSSLLTDGNSGSHTVIMWPCVSRIGAHSFVGTRELDKSLLSVHELRLRERKDLPCIAQLSRGSQDLNPDAGRSKAHLHSRAKAGGASERASVSWWWLGRALSSSGSCHPRPS